MKKILFILVLFTFLTGCQKLSFFSHQIDKAIFQNFGTIFFEKAENYTMDEVHIDSVMMFGKSIFLEGNILEIGDYMTYIILTEGASKILVVSVNITLPSHKPEEMQGKRVKVWAEVENGKKGAPILFAKGLKILDQNG